MTYDIFLDPRIPDPVYVVKIRGVKDDKCRKCLCLIEFPGKDAPLFFVVESINKFPATIEELIESRRFCYEQHTCPENWLRVALVCHKGDGDPHGAFKLVDAVWMTAEYEESDEEEYYLKAVFPQLEVA
jgi:hypothetical protein